MSDSFDIKVSLRTTKGENELEELEGKFRNLVSNAALKPCAKHRLHVFEACRSQPAIDIRGPTPPPTCGECNETESECIGSLPHDVLAPIVQALWVLSEHLDRVK